MSSRSPAPSTEKGCHSAVPGDENSSKNNEFSLEHEKDKEEDEDEEGDVDFNPFLKETLSLEASSSLSSEIEGLDADVVDSGENTRSPLFTTLLPKAPDELQDIAVGEIEHGEEIVMQTTVSSEGAFMTSSVKTTSTRHKKRKSAVIYESDSATIREKESGSSIATDAVNDVMVEEFSNASHSKKLIMDINDEDAICKRTRARYSLASFTLDELETFLQETDDEGDLQNIDDEEEYRKFLAAVLLGGDGNSEAVQENENFDEEDEDNDADFELELEEALESDVDENLKGLPTEGNYEAVGRRPETRQNKRKKVTLRHNKKFSGQLNRPLRPILPYAPITPFPALDGRNIMLESAPNCPSSSTKSGSVNVFTAEQIGRLHCLIYEHVQLLVQVFSLCVFDPSRHHIATQVQGLLSEILHKRDQVLSSQRVPYPSFCFIPLFMHPSVPNGLPQFLPSQSTIESSAFDAQRFCSSGKNMMRSSDPNSPFEDRYQSISSRRPGHFQTKEGFFWVPFISGPVLSVIDVALLNLLESYMDDVSIAVREYQRGHLSVTRDASFEKECLFPYGTFNTLAEANGGLSRASVSPASHPVSSSASDQTPKKTMATTLVEKSKKQSIAPVPKQIAKLAQRFFPLFNPALFPHKPPSASMANRVLFTDAEDGLLARGLMEYNTDWKAIQENFLPCKSRHQIFVRQKNRSCSRAPENPIKAIRRMKSSPLTAEEKARIEEGLKVYKLDWMSVWKYIVPHRDPSLLVRQWRIATGTQKSYKFDEEKKAKRCLYERMRRKSKPAALPKCQMTGLVQDRQQHYGQKNGWSTEEEVDPIPCNPLPSGVPRWQTSSDKEDCGTDNAGGENNSGDDCVDNEDEAYVHEAFLADWRPGPSSMSSEFPSTNLGGNPPIEPFSQEASHVRERIKNSGFVNSQLDFTHKFPAPSKHSQHPLTSHQSTHSVSGLTMRTLEPKFHLRPYRARRTDNLRLVKLAPDLPPVNLPPSVRIMSQSAFTKYQDETSSKILGEGSSGPVKENAVLTNPCPAKSGMSHPTIFGQEKRSPVRCGTSHLDPQVSALVRDNCHAKGKQDSDLHMHPLLFQASEDGSLPYYPLNCSTGVSSSFNFFPQNHHQLNLSLFHSPRQPNHAAKFSNTSLKSKGLNSPPLGIDFHPLLQRADDVNSHSMTAHSVSQLSSDSPMTLTPRQNPGDVVQTNLPDNSSSPATRAISSSPNPRTNELDLDIHLSFTSRKENDGKSRHMNEGNMTSSTVGARESEIIKTQTTSISLNQHTDFRPAPTLEGIANELDSSAPSLVMSSCDVNRINLNDIGNQSLPEIVMEQEELSDSEEEIGENVEFECEEMTDSEGEGGSECDQIDNIQNEDAPDGSLAKVVAEEDNNDQHEPRVCHMSKGERFGMSDTEKDNPNSSLCLSLNSNATPLANPKLPVTRNRSGSQIHKSSKTTTLQQPDLDDVAMTPSKKPRKRAQKPDSGAFMCKERKRDSSTNTAAAAAEGSPDLVRGTL